MSVNHDCYTAQHFAEFSHFCPCVGLSFAGRNLTMNIAEDADGDHKCAGGVAPWVLSLASVFTLVSWAQVVNRQRHLVDKGLEKRFMDGDDDDDDDKDDNYVYLA